MKKSNMKWQEPPQDVRRRTDYQEIAKRLKERPGQWALILEDTTASIVTHINQGRYRDFTPAGAFEATSRNQDGVVKIWARYKGEK